MNPNQIFVEHDSPEIRLQHEALKYYRFIVLKCLMPAENHCIPLFLVCVVGWHMALLVFMAWIQARFSAHFLALTVTQKVFIRLNEYQKYKYMYKYV